MEKETRPDINIIIPVFNTAAYLDELWRSLLAQSCKNFIAICIDDGSTDDSGAILKSWTEEDERFLLIQQPNSGLSSARNRGIDWLQQHPERCGEHILFMDSDDALPPNALARMLEAAKAQDVSQLFFTCDVLFENDALESDFSFYKTFYKRHQVSKCALRGIDYLVECELANELRPSACMQVIKTDLLLDHSIRFYEGIVHEDNLFTAQCLLLNEKTAYLNEPLYLRRVRPNSTMTKPKSPANVKGYFKTGVELLRWAESHDKELTPRQREGVSHLIARMFDSAFNDAANIPAFELSFDSAYEHALYDSTIGARLRTLTQERVTAQATAENSHREAIEETERFFRDSTSWKVGRAITAIPRRLLGR